MNSRNKHIGSRLNDLLEEDGLLQEVTEVAAARVAAWRSGAARRDLFAEISHGFAALAEERMADQTTPRTTLKRTTIDSLTSRMTPENAHALIDPGERGTERIE